MLQHRTVTSPHHHHRHQQQQQQQQPGGRSYSAVAARRLATVGGACAVAEPRLDGVSMSFLVCKMIFSVYRALAQHGRLQREHYWCRIMYARQPLLVLCRNG